MELNIEYNPMNDGYNCIFSHDGMEYYADVCELKNCLPSECMIFAYADGQVTDWGELYCERGVEVSPEGLRVCIEEFVGGLAK
jgi:hypothetical protein